MSSLESFQSEAPQFSRTCSDLSDLGMTTTLSFASNQLSETCERVFPCLPAILSRRSAARPLELRSLPLARGLYAITVIFSASQYGKTSLSISLSSRLYLAWLDAISCEERLDCASFISSTEKLLTPMYLTLPSFTRVSIALIVSFIGISGLGQ